MVAYNTVKPNAYYDSVTLMLFSSKLGEVEGVKEAAVMMGTDHNKALMQDSGLLTAEAAAKITANDLVIGILGEDQASVDAALKVLEEQFENKTKSSAGDGRIKVKTQDAAVSQLGDPNFAVISLPGKYAAAETMKALKNGMHVLLFSDNVTLEEENELKDYAVEHNLLMMGPDCGTACINGVALGFANVVRRGDIGIVAAAGTGLQESMVIVDRLGGGISQALGTGGRDVKEAVGGKMMMLALNALAKDPGTKVIGIVSKPPAKAVMEKILEAVKGIQKPVVACFLGGDPAVAEAAGAVSATTLEDAAGFMVDLSQGKPTEKRVFTAPESEIEAAAKAAAEKIGAGRKYIRGLYSGGTLCYEGMLLLRDTVGNIWSNVALDKKYSLADCEVSQENCFVDMGDDYFTDGMPHPMIDTRLRVERIKKEAADKEVAVILLDCVLGFGCHEDPAGAIVAAKKEADASGNSDVAYVASVCGTDLDIQRRSAQEEKLRAAGIIVMPSNAQATRMAAKILAAVQGK